MENFATKKTNDFVVATGQAFSIRQFVEIASKYLGLKIYWQERIKRSWIFKKRFKKEVIIR